MAHDPGAVLPAPPPPRSTVDPPPAPLEPPRFERLARSPGRRTGLAGEATLQDARRLVLLGPGALHLLDVESGDGVSIRTGSAIVAWDTTRDATSVAILESTGRATVWDVVRGTLERTWQRPAFDGYGWAALSHDGARLALVSGGLAVLDVASGEERFRTALEGESFGLVFTGTAIAVTNSNTGVRSWAVDGGVPTGDTSFQTGGTFGITVSPDTRWAAGAAPDGHGLQVSDLRSKGSLRQLVDGTTCDAHIWPGFSRDSRFVYAHAGTRWIKGFETGSWKPYASFHAPPGRSIAASADDLSRVVTTDLEGGDPRVVQVSDARAILLPDAPAGATFSLSADGTRVLGAAEDMAKVWSASDGAVLHVVTK